MTSTSSFPTSHATLAVAASRTCVSRAANVTAWKRVEEATRELEESGRAPKSVEAFARDVVVQLKDKTIVLMCGNNFLWQMIEWAERDNLELRFAPDSMVCLAGGAKFDALRFYQAGFFTLLAVTLYLLAKLLHH